MSQSVAALLVMLQMIFISLYCSGFVQWSRALVMSPALAVCGIWILLACVPGLLVKFTKISPHFYFRFYGAGQRHFHITDLFPLCAFTVAFTATVLLVAISDVAAIPFYICALPAMAFMIVLCALLLRGAYSDSSIKPRSVFITLAITSLFVLVSFVLFSLRVAEVFAGPYVIPAIPLFVAFGLTYVWALICLIARCCGKRRAPFSAAAITAACYTPFLCFVCVLLFVNLDGTGTNYFYAFIPLLVLSAAFFLFHVTRGPLRGIRQLWREWRIIQADNITLANVMSGGTDLSLRERKAREHRGYSWYL
eukprot:TRINITY_DN2849_c0_g1_i1.p2 TRINITY_DN2849_c0_g1~~TRINITY_DN2849_c0_g1_i1.p2  ORF type:complete len:308 (-),score=40.90 TRINITY_DN2849_c0_g1_i1:79-1002(-)